MAVAAPTRRSRRMDCRFCNGAKSQIFVMNADATNDHNISGENTPDGWPAWSNDGKRVVFSRRVNDRFQLFVMNGAALLWRRKNHQVHVRPSPRRHEPGDFSGAKVAPR